MPGSKLVVFDRAGHFPQLEEPVRFAKLLREFIESTQPAEIEFSDEYLQQLRDLMEEHQSAVADLDAQGRPRPLDEEAESDELGATAHARRDGREREPEDG